MIVSVQMNACSLKKSLLNLCWRSPSSVGQGLLDNTLYLVKKPKSAKPRTPKIGSGALRCALKQALTALFWGESQLYPSHVPSRSALSPAVLRRRAEKRRGDVEKPQRRGTNEHGWTGGSPEVPSTPNPSPKGCREFGKGFPVTSEPCEVRRKHAVEARSKQALLFVVATLTSMEPSHTTSGTRADAPAGGTSLHRSPGA